MPQKLSEIGRRYAQARTSQGVRDARVGTTRAQEILSAKGDIAHLDEPVVRLATSPEPLPEPGSEIERDQLQYVRRAAIFELKQDEERLAALAQARDRAREEWRVAQTAVTEAERMLTEVRTYSRGHLIEAYVNGEPTDGLTESHAQVELDECRNRLHHVEQIDSALRHESDSIENGLPQRHHDIARAAGRLVSRSPQFLAVVQRIYRSYAALRDARLIISEIQRQAYLDDDLVRLADNSQPCTGHRFGGYLVDEDLIATWTNAVTRLLTDADAPLPDPNGSGGSAGTNSSNPSPSPVRGAEHRPAPRKRAHGAATPLSRRPAQRKRAGGKAAGMPVRRRASLARERDPVSGKWLKKKRLTNSQPREVKKRVNRYNRVPNPVSAAMAERVSMLLAVVTSMCVKQVPNHWLFWLMPWSVPWK